MTPKRVLYVTISNWGVGDELALRGTHMLMDKVWPGHLKFYADKAFTEMLDGYHDDLWKMDVWNYAEHSAFGIDLVVHAGGNSWSGATHIPWEAAIIKRGWPVIYMGVGMSGKVNDRIHSVMRNCPLFIGRDHVAVATAREFGAANVHKLCCPSLFLSKAIPAGDLVGLVYQHYGAVSAHSCGRQELHDAQVDLFRRILKRQPCLIICHWIGDYQEALRLFPKHAGDIVYSRLLDDYFRWYGACGKILSMRLHGAYLGATLGLPTICLKEGVGKSCALSVIGVPVRHPCKVNSADMSLYSSPVETERLKKVYREQYLELLNATLVKGNT